MLETEQILVVYKSPYNINLNLNSNSGTAG